MYDTIDRFFFDHITQPTSTPPSPLVQIEAHLWAFGPILPTLLDAPTLSSGPIHLQPIHRSVLPTLLDFLSLSSGPLNLQPTLQSVGPSYPHCDPLSYFSRSLWFIVSMFHAVTHLIFYIGLVLTNNMFVQSDVFHQVQP